MKLTAQDIEIAVAAHFGHRVNLIVPNVHWGWQMRHEADMLVLRPSGYCDEVEIKVTRGDIKADAAKRYSHWSDARIARVWFAVPYNLSACPDIPAATGILAVMRGTHERDADGCWRWRPWRPGDTCWHDNVTVVRAARLRDKATRTKVSDRDRLKLAELGAMRIWALKAALATKCRDLRSAGLAGRGEGTKGETTCH